jgi:hypothetical protein
MASVKLLNRIKLEKYLRSLKATAEGPIFRTTQKALEFELYEQRSTAEEAAWLAHTISPAEESLSDELQNIQDNVEINEAGLEYLTGITAMEQLYSNLSALTASRSCDLALKGMGAPYSLHNMTPEVDACWDNIQRYAEISNIHLRNAAEYHQFYYHTKQLYKRVCQITEQLDVMFEHDDWSGCEGTPYEARILNNALKVSGSGLFVFHKIPTLHFS